ncbi:hypothetical protein MY4824_009865 [Beauveria thailandica]
MACSNNHEIKDETYRRDESSCSIPCASSHLETTTLGSDQSPKL